MTMLSFELLDWSTCGFVLYFHSWWRLRWGIRGRERGVAHLGRDGRRRIGGVEGGS